MAKPGGKTASQNAYNPERASLLRLHLEPTQMQPVHVTPQPTFPVASYLVYAALFFTSCVGMLLISTRPELSVNGMVTQTSNLMESSAQSGAQPEWHDQNAPVEELKIDHEKLGITQKDQAAFDPEPGFENWRGAPYWQHFTEMPVSFNRDTEHMKKEKLVIVSHSTDRAASPLFAASIHKHGLAAAVSGLGTWWHNYEDKNMGLKAALLKMDVDSDPVVMFTDASDSMFTCSAEEMLSRFNKLGADLVVGTQAQCWPPEEHNCNMGKKVLEEGLAAGMEVDSEEGRVSSGYGSDRPVSHPRPRLWANGGLIMGRRSKVLELIGNYEQYLVENQVLKQKRGRGTMWGEFYKSCKPFNMTHKEWSTAIIGEDSPTYDDQVCINRYVIEKARERDLRVKLDRDSTLLHSMGGTEPEMYNLDESNRPYWPVTMKTPCVWHFNNPICKAYMKPMIAKFPGAFV